MPVWSLRRVLDKNPELDFRHGLRTPVRFAPVEGFSGADGFPFKGLRALIRASFWPDVRQVSINPDEIDPGRWTEAVNGLALDYDFLYVVTEGYFFKIPLDTPLDRADPKRINLGWPHGGGCSLHRGMLYVAVEGSPDKKMKGQVWVVDPRTVTVVAKQTISATGDCPWISIDPAGRFLYHSKASAGSADQIDIFRFRAYPDFLLSPVGSLTLVTESGDPIDLQSVQAGLVTPNNHLVVLCDTPEGEAVSGLHLFDIYTGRRRWHKRFEREYDDEFECLLMADFAENGLLHVGMLNKDLDIGRESDDLSLVNFDTPSPFDRWML